MGSDVPDGPADARVHSGPGSEGGSSASVWEEVQGPAEGNLKGHLVRGTARFVGLLVVDLVVIGISRLLLKAARAGTLGQWAETVSSEVLPLGSISGAQLAVAVVGANVFFGGYRAGDRWRDPVRVLSAAGAGVLLALYSDLWHGQAAVVFGRGVLIWLMLGPMFVAARSCLYQMLRRYFKNGLRHRVVEITGEVPRFESVRLGPSYELVKSLQYTDLPIGMAAMERWLPAGVDTILVRGHVPGDRFGELTDFALTHGCRLLCLPRAAQLLGIDSKRVWMEGHPLSELTAPGLRASHLVLKRLLDLLFASLTIVAMSPILVLVALWVRFDSPGPVLFRQDRPGMRGTWFQMMKFRSMRSDAEEALRADPSLYEAFLENDCKIPESIDPRLTRSGRFIRKTSLDELPQLFNVLKGEMSLVGPRPLIGPEIQNYGGRAPTLLSVRPGITGLWQVSGRSRVSYPERAEMDLEYVRNWSFLRDLWILALTPMAVLLRRGAH